MKTTKTIGMTIYEVLVSIAIIMILAILIFTAGRKSVNVAKSTGCLSNLKQLATAMTIYKEDNGDYPINLPNGPVKAYLSGEVLKCHLGKEPNNGDYTMHAFWPDWYTRADELRACQQIRGGSVPIILDQNHFSVLLKKSREQMFFFIARADTSVKRYPFSHWEAGVKAHVLNPNDQICPSGSLIQNF